MFPPISSFHTFLVVSFLLLAVAVKNARQPKEAHLLHLCPRSPRLWIYPVLVPPVRLLWGGRRPMVCKAFHNMSYGLHLRSWSLFLCPVCFKEHVRGHGWASVPWLVEVVSGSKNRPEGEDARLLDVSLQSWDISGEKWPSALVERCTSWKRMFCSDFR